MFAINRAMLWELWQLSKFELFMRIGGQSLFLLLLASIHSNRVAARTAADGPESQLIAGLIVVILGIGSVFSGAWLNELDSTRAGFTFRLGFLRPVRTFHLVIVPMAYLILATWASYGLPAALFEMVTGIDVPLRTPCIFATCTAVLLACAVWSASSHWGRMVNVLVLAVVLLATAIYFGATRTIEKPLLISLGDSSLYEVGWFYYVLAAGVATVAIIGCVACVDRQRHGERVLPAWPWFPTLALVRPEAGKATLATMPAYPSQPWQAQVWFELRRAGVRMFFLTITLPLLIAVVLSSVQWAFPDWTLVPTMWLLAVIVSPVFYQILAAEFLNGLRRQGTIIELSLFDAVRPMRTDQLILVKLLVGISLSIVGFAMMSAVALTHLMLTTDGSAILSFQLAVYSFISKTGVGDLVLLAVALLTGMAMIGVAALGFTLALPLFGRYLYMVLLLGTGLIAVYVFQTVYRWQLDGFWTTVVWLVATAAMALAVLSLKVAITRTIAGPLYAMLAALLFLAWMATGWRLWAAQSPILESLSIARQLALATVSVSGQVVVLLLPAVCMDRYRHQ